MKHRAAFDAFHVLTDFAYHLHHYRIDLVVEDIRNLLLKILIITCLAASRPIRLRCSMFQNETVNDFC